MKLQIYKRNLRIKNAFLQARKLGERSDDIINQLVQTNWGTENEPYYLGLDQVRYIVYKQGYVIMPEKIKGKEV